MGRPKLLSTVIGEGDRRASLVALRNRLAREIEAATSSRDVAVLAKQLADLIRELDSLPTGEEATVFDDLTARRTSRRRAAAGS